MFLRAEDRSKAQVFLSKNDRTSLAVYAEHSPGLEPRCDSFSVYRKGRSCQKQMAFVLLMLHYKSLIV